MGFVLNQVFKEQQSTKCLYTLVTYSITQDKESYKTLMFKGFQGIEFLII